MSLFLRIIDLHKLKRNLIRESIIFSVLAVIIILGSFISRTIYDKIDADRKIYYKKMKSSEPYNVTIYQEMFNHITAFNGGKISEGNFTRKIISDTTYARKFWQYTGGEKTYGSWESFIEGFRFSEVKYDKYLQVKEDYRAIIEYKKIIANISKVFFFGLLISTYPVRIVIFIIRNAIKSKNDLVEKIT